MCLGKDVSSCRWPQTQQATATLRCLCRYLQEKDLFEKYYKQHLSKRLLAGRIVSG